MFENYVILINKKPFAMFNNQPETKAMYEFLKRTRPNLRIKIKVVH